MNFMSAPIAFLSRAGLGFAVAHTNYFWDCWFGRIKSYALRRPRKRFHSLVRVVVYFVRVSGLRRRFSYLGTERWLDPSSAYKQPSAGRAKPDDFSREGFAKILIEAYELTGKVVAPVGLIG